jgi:hypothetical protein
MDGCPHLSKLAQVKIPSQHAAYHLLGVDLLLSDEKVSQNIHMYVSGSMYIHPSTPSHHIPHKPTPTTPNNTETALVRLQERALLRAALPAPGRGGRHGLLDYHELLPALGLLPRLLLVRICVYIYTYIWVCIYILDVPIHPTHSLHKLITSTKHPNSPAHEGPSPYVGDAKLDALLRRFLEGDDDFRNQRCALLFNVIHICIQPSHIHISISNKITHQQQAQGDPPLRGGPLDGQGRGRVDARHHGHQDRAHLSRPQGGERLRGAYGVCADVWSGWRRTTVAAAVAAASSVRLTHLHPYQSTHTTDRDRHLFLGARPVHLGDGQVLHADRLGRPRLRAAGPCVFICRHMCLYVYMCIHVPGGRAIDSRPSLASVNTTLTCIYTNTKSRARARRSSPSACSSPCASTTSMCPRQAKTSIHVYVYGHVMSSLSPDPPDSTQTQHPIKHKQAPGFEEWESRP